MGVTVIKPQPGIQGPVGPQGPQGPQGPPGDGWAAYTWEQQTASDVWGPIPHNLGFYPSVTLLDGLGREQDVEVHHHDVNSVTIYLAVPESGKATFS